MNNTSVLETRRVKDFIYRLREPDKGKTFWTIEYRVSDEVPPEVTVARREQQNQYKLQKKFKAQNDIPENTEARK